MYVNTVGNVFLKKDIYIIKNRINNKVYIGQSINPEMRFIQHCKPSSAFQNSLIDRAIQKYGANNFWFEVLESDVKNYNEREKFWIAKYNSINPNGYNISLGGENPPTHYAIEHPLSKFKDIKEIEEIKKELRATNLPFSEIGKKYNVSKRTIMRINQGLHYEKIDESYPIRKIPNMNGKLNDSQIKEIIEILKFSYRQYEDIAKQYGVSISAIKRINSGNCHSLKGIDYPIRKYKNSGKPACTYSQVTEIIDLLKNSNISYTQIAKCYKLDVSLIYLINNGKAKRYCRENIKYPIRQYN